MYICGVDVGSKTAKAVILGDNSFLSQSVLEVTATWREEANRVLQSVLKKAGLERNDLKYVVATGGIEEDWEEADEYLSEVSCAANAAVYVSPSAKTVIDMGAETCLCSKCDSLGTVLDYIVNQKCASGTGLFMDIVAGVLGIKTNDIGRLSLNSTKKIEMNMTCAVFAESEVVSLVHQGEKIEDILSAIHNSIATRTKSMLKNIKFEEDVVFIGGVARNKGMVTALSEVLGCKITVPDNPETLVALGAALEAKHLV